MRDSLLQALLTSTEQGDSDPNCQLRMGTVTQVSPLLVKVGASTVGQPASKLSSYVPSVNDYVAVLLRGADRIVLDAIGGGSIPRFRLSKSGTQAIAAATIVDATFDTETSPAYDPRALHSGSDAFVTIPAAFAGLWTFGYTVDFAAGVAGDREAWIVSSAGSERYADTVGANVTSNYRASGSSDLVCSAGDTVKVQVFQNTGASNNIGTTCRFWGSYRGPS